MSPGQVDWENLLASFLAAEDAAECATRLGPARLVVVGELVGIKHGVGDHGVRGHLRAFSPQLDSCLSG